MLSFKLARAAMLLMLFTFVIGAPNRSPVTAAPLAQTGDGDHQVFVPAILRYTSNLNDSFEPNDSRTMAHGALKTSWPYESWISRADDEDWYYVDVLTPGWIYVEVQSRYLNEMCGVEGELYDSNGLGVAYSFDNGMDIIHFQTLTPGRFYLRLMLKESYNDITTCSYSLTMRYDIPTKGEGDIYGMVKAHGQPVANLPIRLYMDPPVFTQTDQTGTYHFREIPTAMYGAFYEVGFINWGNVGPGYAGYAAAPLLEGYSTHNVKKMPDLDISPINLVLPSPGAHLTPPFEFRWNVRPTSPLEWYGVYMCCSFEDKVLSTGLIGRENNYMLYERPAGLPTETPLYWGIYAYAEDGSYAESYYANYISFHMPELGPHSLEAQEQRLPIELMKERGRKEPLPVKR